MMRDPNPEVNQGPVRYFTSEGIEEGPVLQLGMIGTLLPEKDGYEYIALPGTSGNPRSTSPRYPEGAEVQQDDQEVNLPNHWEHNATFWAQCITDSCEKHLGEKVRHKFYPRRYHNFPLERPMNQEDMQHWEIVNVTCNGECAIFHYKEWAHTACQRGEVRAKDCTSPHCKKHQFEKVLLWHETKLRGHAGYLQEDPGQGNPKLPIYQPMYIGRKRDTKTRGQEKSMEEDQMAETTNVGFAKQYQEAYERELRGKGGPGRQEILKEPPHLVRSPGRSKAKKENEAGTAIQRSAFEEAYSAAYEREKRRQTGPTRQDVLSQEMVNEGWNLGERNHQQPKNFRDNL